MRWLRSNGFDPVGMSLNGNMNEASGAAAAAPLSSAAPPSSNNNACKPPTPVKKFSPIKMTPVLL
jgi:hypothetical protein